MSNLSDLLSQCVEMTHQLIKTKQRATIDIRIGSDFKYQFCNQEDEGFEQKKKLSPSQRKRNFLRKSEFEHLKQVEKTSDAIKVEANSLEAKVFTIDSEAQTDPAEAIIKKDMEAQTDPVLLESIGVNTDEHEIDSLENILDVDKNGQIHPKNNEILVEMKLNHGIKNWQEIESTISENLQLPLIGKPWISNNGRHFMTVGFRTKIQDFENWKIRTFNWQESGIGAVSSSRLYR
jgi:hypothetical protein